MLAEFHVVAAGSHYTALCNILTMGIGRIFFQDGKQCVFTGFAKRMLPGRGAVGTEIFMLLT